jgi:RNA polymerase sigma-70 factor (ECF subfamily)
VEQVVPLDTDVSVGLRSAMERVAGFTVPRHLVEDVVQDVLLAVARSPQKFDARRGSYRSYLLTMTRGRAVDVWRSETARRRREERSLGAKVSDSAEQVAMSGGVRARTLEALRLLPDIEREPITLAFFGELTYQQVAARLDLPEGTVKGRIRNGLHRLRTLVELSDLN